MSYEYPPQPPPEGGYPPPPPTEAGYPPPPPPDPEPPKPQRRRWPWIVGGVVVVLAIIGAVAAGANDDDGTKTASKSETTTEPEPDPETTNAPATTETPTTTAPEEPATLAMGQTLSFTVADISTDAATNIDAVVANPITADREPAEYGMEPTRGLFLVVDVSVKARPDSEGSYFASPYEFKFVANDGTVVESGYVGEGFGPELPTTELAAGQQIAGKVGFDIAPGQEVGGRIQINDSGENYGEPFAFWTL